jgi:D-alanyl-D-alanine carboxypeptidase (penicillin-binding protein 5/6)
VEAKTGTILYAKNEHQLREPASITKVMTSLVAIERADLADVVSVSANAARVGGSSLYLKAGDVYKLEELIRATMLRSGNDGATAIAEHVGGSVSDFVSLMNTRAHSMGLKKTRFVNPHGLTAPGHYSTAYDIALMCMVALANPKFADIVSTAEHWASTIDDDRARVVYNTNRLLWSFAGADGIKTGTTSRAGHCLAASATRDGLQFIAVVLRSGARWHDAAVLLEYGFQNFTRVTLARRGEAVAEALVAHLRQPYAEIGPLRDVDIVLRKDEVEKVTTHVDVPARLRATVPCGRMAGHLRIFYDGEEVSSYPLYVFRSVSRRGVLGLTHGM